MYVSNLSQKYFVENSELKESFSIKKESILNKSLQAEVDTTSIKPSSEDYTEHIDDLSCKCVVSFITRI